MAQRYRLAYTSKFKRDYRRAKKRHADISGLEHVLGLLAAGEALPESCHDHELRGAYRGHRECHIGPDWLLIYLVRESELVLTAVRCGTHSDLFDE